MTHLIIVQMKVSIFSAEIGGKGLPSSVAMRLVMANISVLPDKQKTNLAVDEERNEMHLGRHNDNFGS